MRGLVGLVFVVGCYHPDIVGGAPCGSDADCPAPLACIAGHCAADSPVDARPEDGRGSRIDAAVPPDSAGACADHDLGSAMGAVASGTTANHPDHYGACGGIGAAEVTYAWTAPADGTYTIDLCASPFSSFDSVLSVRDGSCGGQQIACDDDGCGVATFMSKLAVHAKAGQLYVIVVDGRHTEGQYTLTISK